MTKGLPHNCVQVVMHPNTFEVGPVANVRAGFEPLLVIVDWSDNQETWLAVTLCNFRGPNGETPAEPPGQVTFTESEGKIVKAINFPDWVDEPLTLKYEVHFERADPPETFILDPTIILRPGDWNPDYEP